MENEIEDMAETLEEYADYLRRLKAQMADKRAEGEMEKVRALEEEYENLKGRLSRVLVPDL